MTSNELYYQILGLAPPWRVSDVDLDLSIGQIRVHVEHNPSDGRLRCSTCGQECPGYDTQEERTWRHLDTCQFMTYLVCSVPRIECPVHGVRPAQAPWAEPNSRFTLLFERLAITVLLATQAQSRAASLLRLSPDQVRRLMHRAVQRGLKRRSADEIIETLSIDEKAYADGHKYATVLSDSQLGRILDLIEGRTKNATVTLLERNLTLDQRKLVTSVTMDMWAAFAIAVKQVLPNADIVHDRFHVAGYLNKAVDDTRKAEHARLAKQGASPLTKTKYLWLKNPDNLTDDHKALLNALQEQDMQTPRAWAFKDAFREFFNLTTIKAAEAFFLNWYSAAIELGNRHLTKVANMLNKHLQGLLAYTKHRTTNAQAEAINSKIQLVKANARGYRKFENFRIAVLFFHGKLILNP